MCYHVLQVVNEAQAKLARLYEEEELERSNFYQDHGRSVSSAARLRHSLALTLALMGTGSSLLHSALSCKNRRCDYRSYPTSR